MTRDATPAATPARPHRRRDRKDQIAYHASELFARNGFHSVRVDDIANASGITARAVYRHFESKQALLSHVILAGQARLLDVLAATCADDAGRSGFAHVLAALAPESLTSLRLAPLWQREARHLTEEDYRRVREGTRAIAMSVRQAIHESFPDLDPYSLELRAWATVSILTSPGHYELRLPRNRFTALLIAMSGAAVNAPPSSPADGRSAAAQPPRIDRSPASRREQLITAAARAFRRSGYGGVGIDDFGGDIGIAGPAVYRYFDNKANVLATAIYRFQEWVAHDTARGLRAATDDLSALTAMVAGYARIALEETDLLAVTITESIHLPQRTAELVRRMRSDARAEWVLRLRAVRPELTGSVPQVLVNTAHTAIEDLVRIPHLSGDPRFAQQITDCALAVLCHTSAQSLAPEPHPVVAGGLSTPNAGSVSRVP